MTLPPYRRFAARVYRDIVRRRTSVRVHQASFEARLQQPPSFLLGLYRSGTTPLRYSLGMDGSIATPPETDFLGPFLQSMQHERGLSGLSSLGYDEAHVVATYRHAADYFYANYADSLGQDVRIVLDKSPSYVDHIDGLRAMFPSSKFICLTRHPLGQIGSATRHGSIRPEIPNFPETGGGVLHDACEYWSQRTQALLDFSAGPNVLRIRYEDLCASPEPALRRILSFLEIPWNADVLEYDGAAQDRGKEGAKALGLSSFQPGMADPLRGWQQRELNDLQSLWTLVEPTASQLQYGKAGVSE